MNKRALGTEYEQKAADFLEKQGLVILERNYRCRQGEVDLIAREENCLVFVEVKYRTGHGCGSALAAVTRQKQKVISRVARFYLYSKCHTDSLPCRFDVIGIEQGEVQWIKNAFEAQL